MTDSEQEYRERVMARMRSPGPKGTRADFHALATQVAKGYVAVTAIPQQGIVYLICEDESDAVPLIEFFHAEARQVIPVGVAVVVRSMDVIHEALAVYYKSLRPKPSRWQRFWNWVWRRQCQ